MTFITPYHAFVALAEIDRHVAQLDRAIEQALKSHAARETELAVLREALSVLHKLLFDEKRILAEHEQTITELRARKDRCMTKRERASSVRECQSLDVEMAALDTQIDTLETELIEHLDRFEAGHADRRQRTADAEKGIAQKIEESAEIAAKIGLLRAERETFIADRVRVVPAVESELYGQYEALRERDAVPAVPVFENRCGGCHTVLTAKELALVRRHAFAHCPECYKFLYTRA